MSANLRQSATPSARGKRGRVGSAAAVVPGPAPVVANGELRRVPLESIVISHRRIRRDLGDLDALALSLHLHGQLAPVIVHEVGNRYHLIAGERRLEATRRLHEAQVKSGQAEATSTATISVIIRQLQPGENPGEIELAENAQRRELSDDEEADALIRLVRDGGREMREVAAIAGRSIAYVSKRVRMFEDVALRAALVDRRITPAQAEELLSLPEKTRPRFLELAISAGWGSKEIREAVQSYQDQDLPPEPSGGKAHDRPDSFSDQADLEDVDYDAMFDSLESYSSLETESESPRTIVERPRDLTRRITELNAVLRDLRPFQLKPADDRALRQLWTTLRQLAQAPRVPMAQKFPSIADAESLARRR
jgi:ParB family chromosome partitioning protein